MSIWEEEKTWEGCIGALVLLGVEGGREFVILDQRRRR